MKNFRIAIVLLITSFCLKTNIGYAEIKLPAIISSNMVLQRNADVTLWGWAEANQRIKIQISWLDSEKTVKADGEGNWQIQVHTTDVKTAQSITISDGTQTIALDDILFGEVWVCSGQSNMFQPLLGYTGQPVEGGLDAIVKSTNKNIRLFTVQRNAAKEPLKDVEKFDGWDYARPETVANFSAVAYLFGKQLQEVLDVPVGLIHTSWGGSRIQAWMAAKCVGEFEKVEMDTVNLKHQTNQVPSVLFNAMINPLIPYTIKGFLWYQGESNRTEPGLYREMFPAMVTDWRAKWGIGDFPFYYAQIAPYSYGARNAFGGVDNTAFLREAQLQSLNKIPNSGMAVTLDVGEEGTIHPRYKKQVADRLLYLALNQTYGYKTVDYSGPVYDSMEAKDDGIYVYFKQAELGLFAEDVQHLDGFELAGEDHVFYPAKAKLYHRESVFLQCKQVPNPVAVRYCWRNWVKGGLFDTNMLPVSSFRTDNWSESTRVE